MEGKPIFGEKSKDVVFVIGNGFDLAHDMETHFSHFADHYLDIIDKEIFDLVNTENQERSLIKDNAAEFFLSKLQITGDGQNELSSIRGIYKSQTEKEKRIEKLMYYSNKFYLFLENSFLASLFKNHGKLNNWYRVESFYFDELYRYFNYKDDIGIKKLNNEFNIIKTELVEYLDSVPVLNDKGIGSFFENLRDYYYEISITVINFNYTNTIENYTWALNCKRQEMGKPYDVAPNIFNIHGSLSKEDIVFGYGNDRNKKYKDLIEVENNDYVEHMKTFEYSRNSEYSDLIEYLKGQENYEVCVIGHSLSVTDKTLLEVILDKEKCLKIHLFKRVGKTEIETYRSYKDLQIAAARITEDEGDLRTRITEYTKSQTFP